MPSAFKANPFKVIVLVDSYTIRRWLQRLISILSDRFISFDKLKYSVDANLSPVHVVGPTILHIDALRNSSKIKRFADKLVIAINNSYIDLIAHISL